MMVSIESPKHLFPRPTLESNTIFIVISGNFVLQLEAVRIFFQRANYVEDFWEMKTSPCKDMFCKSLEILEIFLRNTVILRIITFNDILEIIVMINILRESTLLPKQIATLKDYCLLGIKWTRKSFFSILRFFAFRDPKCAEVVYPLVFKGMPSFLSPSFL